MNRVRLSAKAERDLDGIAEFTKERWGGTQAISYLDQFSSAFDALARFPETGRPCKGPGSDYRRMECGSHVLFYRVASASVLVQRILHKSMLPAEHGF